MGRVPTYSVLDDDPVTAMAMFPLGAVLLPGQVMPLHVFEPRYHEMIVDCLRADGEPEFGQVLITRGREVGGGDERAMVATVAQMRQVNALEGNRYSFLAVGSRRIRVNSWLADDPYPNADVEDWPDIDDWPETSRAEESTMVIDVMSRRLRELLQAMSGLGIPGLEGLRDGLASATISRDPSAATYQLAGLAPVGPADRLRLLTSRGPNERLGLLGDVLDDVEAVLKFHHS